MSEIIYKYIKHFPKHIIDTLTLYRIILLVSFLGWVYMAFGDFHDTHAQHLHHNAASHGAVLYDYLIFWPTMSIAMMLPIALPMLSGYTDIYYAAQKKGTPIALPLWFIVGYMFVWVSFSLIMACVSFYLNSLLMPYDTNNVLVLALILTGIYQLTPVKNNCLKKCRTPLIYFIGNWQFTAKGVFYLGVNRGFYCLACCIALMGIMVLSATHTIVAMLGLMLIMYVERVIPNPEFFNKITAIVFFCFALILFV